MRAEGPPLPRACDQSGCTCSTAAAHKAATFRCLALTLVTSTLLAGLAGTPASATQNGFIYICKKAATGSGITGTFTFTVVDPPADPKNVQVSQTVQVPVGGCSGAIMIAQPSPQGITITENPTNSTIVSKIDVQGTTILHRKSSSTITVADDVSTNNQKGSDMSTGAGTITFTNDAVLGSGPVSGSGPATGDPTGQVSKGARGQPGQGCPLGVGDHHAVQRDYLD